MATAQLKLYATDTSNKKLTKTISNVKVNATPAQYLALAQGLNALTTNTYEKTDLVVTTNQDTAEVNGNG